MTEKLKYKFSCAQFHEKFTSYLYLRNCTLKLESDDYDSIKAEIMAHLMQQRQPIPAEHHYQDNPNLNVEEDVDNYLRTYGVGS